MKTWEKYSLGIIAAVILISVIILLTDTFFDSESQFVEDVVLDESLIGSTLESGMMEVQKKIDQGKKSYPIETVLGSKQGFVCLITSQYGPMTLLVKDDTIRQDIVWGDGSTTAFIQGDYVYRYSIQYDKWLRFDYSPDIEIADAQMTRGIFSEFELINKTMPKDVVCVLSEIPEDELDFPIDQAVDLYEILEQVS